MASTPMPPDEELKSLRLNPTPVKNIQVVEFAVSLPKEIEDVGVPSSLGTEKGVVG